MSHSKPSQHVAIRAMANDEAAAPQSTLEGATPSYRSEAPAEWGEEQRSCTRRRSESSADADGSREWAEDQAWCILNAVTIAGAG